MADVTSGLDCDYWSFVAEVDSGDSISVLMDSHDDWCSSFNFTTASSVETGVLENA